MRKRELFDVAFEQVRTGVAGLKLTPLTDKCTGLCEALKKKVDEYADVDVSARTEEGHRAILNDVI